MKHRDAKRGWPAKRPGGRGLTFKQFCRSRRRRWRKAADARRLEGNWLRAECNKLYARSWKWGHMKGEDA